MTRSSPTRSFVDAGAAQVHHGFGIIGMRERAQAVGGDLRVSGPSDLGFEIVTTLPLHPHAPAGPGPAPGVPAPQATP